MRNLVVREDLLAEIERLHLQVNALKGDLEEEEANAARAWSAWENVRSQLVSDVRDAFYAGFFAFYGPTDASGVDQAIRDEEAAWAEYAKRESIVSDTDD